MSLPLRRRILKLPLVPNVSQNQYFIVDKVTLEPGQKDSQSCMDIVSSTLLN